MFSSCDEFLIDVWAQYLVLNWDMTCLLCDVTSCDQCESFCFVMSDIFFALLTGSLHCFINLHLVILHLMHFVVLLTITGWWSHYCRVILWSKQDLNGLQVLSEAEALAAAIAFFCRSFCQFCNHPIWITNSLPHRFHYWTDWLCSGLLCNVSGTYVPDTWLSCWSVLHAIHPLSCFERCKIAK